MTNKNREKLLQELAKKREDLILKDEDLGTSINTRCKTTNELVVESRILWNKGDRHQANAKLWEAEEEIFPNMSAVSQRASITKEIQGLDRRVDLSRFDGRYDEAIDLLQRQGDTALYVGLGLAGGAAAGFAGAIAGRVVASFLGIEGGTENPGLLTSMGFLLGGAAFVEKGVNLNNKMDKLLYERWRERNKIEYLPE